MPIPHVLSSRRRPILVGTVVVVLLVGFGGWRLVSSEADPEAAGEVVADFYLAQRTGDCVRLLEVLSEKSWSDDGERSREEFLEQCPAAIAGYEPPVDDVTVQQEYDNPDRAVVTTYDVGVLSEDLDAAGHLVREDGEWKVETDELILRIGPPADEAARGYLEAYAEGDCEAISTQVTEETWSQNGTLGREEFQQRCEAAMEARDGSLRSMGTTEIVSLSHHGAGDALATVRPPGLGEETDVSLVKEELRWRVRGDEGVPGAPAGTYLHPLRLAELQTELVSHPTAGPRSCHNYMDSTTASTYSVDSGMPRPPKGLAVNLAVSREFSSCYSAVTLYEFADARTARRAVELLADELLEWKRSTLEELNQFDKEYGFEVDVEQNRQTVRDERPDRRVDVPGHPTAVGVRTGCDVGGCFDVAVLLAHENRVIGAYSQIGDLDQAVRLLAVQLEEL